MHKLMDKKLTLNDIPADSRERIQSRLLSLGECEICETPMEVRNTRARILCSKCQRLEPLIKRYTNFQKQHLTKEEKRRILESASGGR